MTQINAYKAVVKNRSSSQFTMTGIDSTGFGSFTGTAFAYRPMTGPGIYMSGMQDHRFINCYLVAIGDDAIQLDCNTGNWIGNSFQFLIEGALDRSVFRVTNGAGLEDFVDCDWEIYNTHCRSSFFSTNGGSLMQFLGGRLRVRSHTTNATLPFVDSANAADYAFFGGMDIYYPNRAGVTPTSYTSFRARLSCKEDGLSVVWGHDVNSILNQNYTPTVTAGSGSITTLGSISGRVKYLSTNLFYMAATVTITTNGTGATTIVIPLPAGVTAQAAQHQVLSAYADVGGARVTCTARVAASGTSIAVSKYDGTYPGADGAVIVVSGLLEIA